MRAAALLACVALAGCTSILPRNQAPKIRYFTPEPPAATTPAAPVAPGLALRLTRVEAAAYIEDRIAFRDAGAEVGYHGALRWAEPPEDVVRRALARALFEERRVQERVSGAGPSLELELGAFEEVRAPRHLARIEVTVRLRADRLVALQRTITVERPIRAAPPDRAGNAIALAMGEALREVVDRVAAEVVAELSPTTAARP